MGFVKSIIAAVSLAMCLLLTLSFLAYRSGLDYHLSNLVGRPDDPYGSQNLVLPRVLRLLMTFVPVVLGASVTYSWMRRGTLQFSPLAMLVVITLIAIPIGLGDIAISCGWDFFLGGGFLGMSGSF